MLKILQARLQQYMNFQMFKLVLEKAEDPEIKLPTSVGKTLKKKQESSRKKIYFCFNDYAKAFHCVDHNAAAAKSLQSCQTLCDPIDKCSTGGSTSWNQDCQEKYQ